MGRRDAAANSGRVSAGRLSCENLRTRLVRAKRPLTLACEETDVKETCGRRRIEMKSGPAAK